MTNIPEDYDTILEDFYIGCCLIGYWANPNLSLANDSIYRKVMEKARAQTRVIMKAKYNREYSKTKERKAQHADRIAEYRQRQRDAQKLEEQCQTGDVNASTGSV